MRMYPTNSGLIKESQSGMVIRLQEIIGMEISMSLAVLLG
jgi:hypothetical protein